MYQWYSKWRWRNQVALADTISEIETRLQAANAESALQTAAVDDVISYTNEQLTRKLEA